MPSEISESELILKRLTPEMGGEIVTIYQTSGNFDSLPKGSRIIAYSHFLKSLECFAMMNSLSSVQPPVFLPTDSDATKTLKALAIEWNSPRKVLNLWLSKGDGWFLQGQVSLYRLEGYVYRIYSLKDLLTDNLAFELGKQASIGVSITAANDGYIDAADVVSIRATIVRECSYKENGIPPNYINYNFTSVSTSGQKIINARPTRRGYQVTNTHATVPLRLSHAESSPTYSIVLSPGQFYPANYDDELYEGSVWVAGLGATGSCVAFEKI